MDPSWSDTDYKHPSLGGGVKRRLTGSETKGRRRPRLLSADADGIILIKVRFLDIRGCVPKLPQISWHITIEFSI